MASASCGAEVNARAVSGADARPVASGSTGGEVHNNVMVATRSISLELQNKLPATKSRLAAACRQKVRQRPILSIPASLENR
jgi:hypothetical protein